MKSVFRISLMIVILFCRVNSFSQDPFFVFFGNLHSHTGDSDGAGTPADAFSYAKDTAHLDFMAVTDHVEQVDLLEWWSLKSVATNATINGTFVALAGYEWGSPLYGHCNQLNIDELLLEVGWFYTDWGGFRQWVIDNPPSIGQFNHPADEIYFTNWDNFAYQGAQSDSIFPLIEFQSIQQATDWYEESLKKGWHLSPVWNQDNHSADWGTKNDCRAGIWATELSESALYEAIKRRRTFATMDKNASVWFDVCGLSMGSDVPRMYNSPVHIRLYDSDNEGWSNIELVSQNGLVLSFSSTSSFLDTTVYLSPVTEEWIFIRVTQADADMLWSAPVHFTGTISNREEETILSDDVMIFPNPSGSYINIQCQEANNEASVLIYDLCGQLLIQQSLKNNKIDISNLSKGSYIMKLYSDNCIYVRPFVKE